MALWGNNDNVTSAGIVTCDYTTTDSDGNVIVNGWLTNFGAVGSAKTGDVIRFGLRDPLDATAVYMGDAVIVSIAGTSSFQLDLLQVLVEFQLLEQIFRLVNFQFIQLEMLSIVSLLLELKIRIFTVFQLLVHLRHKIRYIKLLMLDGLELQLMLIITEL